MALPQRDNLIDAIKRTDALLERAVMMGDEAEAERLRDGVEGVSDRVLFLGASTCNRLPGFISVSFPGHSAEGLMHLLDLKGIAVSTGAACDSKNTQISHVLKAINAPREVAESTIRVTFGPENTIEDVDAIIASLRMLLKRK